MPKGYQLPQDSKMSWLLLHYCQVTWTDYIQTSFLHQSPNPSHNPFTKRHPPSTHQGRGIDNLLLALLPIGWLRAAGGSGAGG